MNFFVKKALERSIRKMSKTERVGPRVLSLESVNYFETSEYFNRRKKERSS